MRIPKTLAIASFIISCLTTLAWADIPHQMNVQGVLVDTSGASMTNVTVEVTFTIFDAASGGTAKWTEIDTVITDGAGVFSIALGAESPIPDSVFSDTVRWLGIQVEAEPELTPRTQLVSGPYSFASGNAGTGGGGGWIDNGSVVALATTADSVGIGTSTPTEQLEVAGNVRVSGTASIGTNHTLTGASGFVAGDSNTVSGEAATVAGGFRNFAGGDHSAVGGGMDNVATGQWSTVSGGDSSTASGSRATIGGGQMNVAIGNAPTVGGGKENTAINFGAVVGGGIANTAGHAYTTVAGGSSNLADSISATIGGGSSNTASAVQATVGGGANNSALGENSTVSGGFGGLASGRDAVVGGGSSDTASADGATVSGGIINVASGTNSVIGGGGFNAATGVGATVAGGDNNTADADRATVGGGQFDTASGLWATVPGGYMNTAAGSFSFAAGKRAKALHNGTFVWADNSSNVDFASTTADQFLIRSQFTGIGRNYRITGAETFGIKKATTGFGGMYIETDATGDPFYGYAANGVVRAYHYSNGNNGTWTVSVANTDHLFLAMDGTLGLGVAVPTYRLTLPNDITTKGRGIAYAWVTYSSRRWKSDIETMGDALAKVDKLRGVTYKDKESGLPSIGVIAEEVGEVFPEVVDYEDNGVDARSVDYARLVSVLIEAVKELKTLSDEQSARIDELRSEVATLSGKPIGAMGAISPPDPAAKLVPGKSVGEAR